MQLLLWRFRLRRQGIQGLLQAPVPQGPGGIVNRISQGEARVHKCNYCNCQDMNRAPHPYSVTQEIARRKFLGVTHTTFNGASPNFVLSGGIFAAIYGVESSAVVTSLAL